MSLKLRINVTLIRLNFVQVICQCNGNRVAGRSDKKCGRRSNYITRTLLSNWLDYTIYIFLPLASPLAEDINSYLSQPRLISKIFDKLFLITLTQFLNRHNLLSDSQFGFSKRVVLKKLRLLLFFSCNFQKMLKTKCIHGMGVGHELKSLYNKG